VFVETDPSPSTFGQPVTISALIHWGSRGLEPNRSVVDSVEFFDGSISLGTVPWDRNTVSIVFSTLAVGDHAITATYSGTCVEGNEFAPGTSQPVEQVVTPAAYPLAVDPPAAGAIVSPAAAEAPTETNDQGPSTLPIAVIAGSGLTAAAALAYRRSRPEPEPEPEPEDG
jgi:hypothetical protein